MIDERERSLQEIADDVRAIAERKIAPEIAAKLRECADALDGIISLDGALSDPPNIRPMKSGKTVNDK